MIEFPDRRVIPDLVHMLDARKSKIVPLAEKYADMVAQNQGQQARAAEAASHYAAGSPTLPPGPAEPDPVFVRKSQRK
jgi:hypothetical protein